MNKLIQNSGLAPIVEYIFVFLDNETLDDCHLVCKAWHDFINENKLIWTVRLRRNAKKQIRVRDFGQIRFSDFGQEYPDWMTKLCSQELSVSVLKRIYLAMKIYCQEGNEYEVGESPLHYAIKIGRLDVVEALAKTKLDFNAAIELYLVTPFHVACSQGHLDVVTFLLGLNINFNAKNFLGMTPFLWACLNGRTDIVELLLKVAHLKGINTNDPDNAGLTPLHWACSNGHYYTVDLLIKSGIDVEVKDRSGSTPVHYARLNGHMKTVQLFEE